MVRNPVMFIVSVSSIATTALWLQALAGAGEAPAWFIGTVSLWLWLTVLFANFSEALAEGRGKAQAEALRRARRDTPCKRLRGAHYGSSFETIRRNASAETYSSLRQKTSSPATAR
jgi:K+-transporting ATPase ATPase B chain